MKATKDTRGRRRDLIRMAVRLHERLSQRERPMLTVLPESQWRECQRLVRLHERAVWKGWLAAAEWVRPRMEKALRDFQQRLAQALDRRSRPQHSPLPAILSPGDIHAELVSLFGEFDEVECDVRERTVSVVTGPVTLDSVYLGPFRIELDLEYGDDGLPDYRVCATDPNPAACDEEVTHPHVCDGCLCAGEGSVPIRRALEEGRVGDFFQIVTQVLHTYNPGSAYVELDEWEGVSCVACGTSVSDHERTRCYRTADTVCLDCAVTCPDCDHDFAPDRTEVCEGCDEPFCTHCLDEGLCHDCREKAREGEREQEAAQNEGQPAETAPGRCGGLAADGAPTEPLAAALAR